MKTYREFGTSVKAKDAVLLWIAKLFGSVCLFLAGMVFVLTENWVGMAFLLLFALAAGEFYDYFYYTRVEKYGGSK